jgi:hypothetical protein
MREWETRRMNCKPHSIPVLLLALAAALPPLCGAEDATVAGALEKAEVRIPYLELRKLWESANATAKPPEPERLLPGALLSAQYKVDLGAGKIALEAEFKVESFDGKWERIRLMGAGPAVASIEPADTPLVVEDDALCVIAKNAGPLAIKVRFVESALPASGDAPFLKIVTAPSAVASLMVTTVPQGRLVKSKEGVLMSDAAKSCSLALPAKGGEVALALTDAALVPKAEPPPPPPQPSEWSLQNEVLVLEGEGELNYRVHAHATALNGSALEAVLLLPPNARSLKVDGEDVAESRQARNADGQTELRIRWHTRDQMERELKMSYALQQLPLAETWELRTPSLPQEDKVKSLFMFALPPGVEFKGVNLQGPVPPAKRPRWNGEETKAPEFGTVSGAASATLQTKLLPRLETAVAIITKGEYTTKLMGDGSVLTEAKIEMEHDDSFRWSFSLPEKSELLKCAVNDAPMKPIARDKGVMEIPLGHAPGTKTATSVITFSFTSAQGKLQAVEGAATLALPLTPVFIQELNWSVELPESYEVTGIDPPEMSGPSVSNAPPNTTRLVKKLCRNEQPQVQLFYHKRGIE